MADRGTGFGRARVMALVLATMLTTGCISPRQISTRAVDYNVAAENARSEMLLLNVLRARDRKPLIFTGLTRISGSIRSQVGISASGQIGPDASNVRNLAPNASFSDAPNFDVAVLDSQEFTRGIMTPISFELIEYLWDQGFPREMLMLLAFERIDVECPTQGGEIHSLLNDPTEPSWEAFRAFVDTLDFEGEWQIDDHLVERIGPPLDEAGVKSLGTLLSVAGSQLNLRRVEGDLWQLERPSVGLRLEAPGVDPCGLGTSASYRLYESKSKFRRAKEVSADEPKARVVLRSPQSVLFYLGEQSREGREVLLRDRPDKTEFERRLFAIESSSRCGKAHVKVEYDGAGEVIPNGSGACDPGRSMQALSLAAVLLSLQQSARDLPIGGTVRIIGQ